MIVILCETFQAAIDAFEEYLSFLYDNDPWCIKKIFEHCNCVETDEDLRYIFIDQRFKSIFEGMRPDIIFESDFFDGIHEYYY